MSIDKTFENDLDALYSIIEDSVNEIYIFDKETLHFIYANNAVLSQLGYTKDEIKDLTPLDIKPKFSKKELTDLLEPLVLKRQDNLIFETIHKRKDGSLYDVEIRLQLISLQGKEKFIVFANDISERVESVKKLQESEEKFKKIAETSLMGIFIYKEKMLYANDAFLKISGYTLDELHTMHAWSFTDENSKELIKGIALRRLAGEQFPQTYNDMKFYRKDGKVRIMRVMSQTIQYEGSFAGLGTLMDITDIQENKEKLKKLATTDSLTGIHNRYKINYELDVQLLRAKRFDESFCVLMLDLDHFKAINDNYGHDTGDYVLQKFTALISEHIREVDCFGRWGGEEFLIILPYQEVDEAIVVAQKVKNIIEKYTFDKVETVTVSIGVAQYMEGDTKETLLKKADEALYEAKNAGRNLVIFK